MSVLAHHRGANTTAVGLKAGVSPLIISFMGDQPFGGQGRSGEKELLWTACQLPSRKRGLEDKSKRKME
jgi:hypothetical protein